MAFRIFDAEGRLDLDDTAARSKLKRFGREFKETMGGVRRERADAHVGLDTSEYDRKIEDLKRRQAIWEKRRANAHVGAATEEADRKLTYLALKLRLLEKQKHRITVEVDNDTLERSIGNLGRLVFWLKRGGRSADDTRGIFRRMGDALHNARIEVGPLSLSLRGLIVSLATLAPIVSSVVGVLGALVASLSSAAVGALGLASALGTGLVFQLGAITTVMKPVLADFKRLTEEQKAYTKAVQRYGKGSDQAADALKRLRHVQRALGPDAARAARSWDQLADRWDRLTRASRGVIFEGIDHALDRVNKRLPIFARLTNQTFRVAGRSVRDFTDTLTGREATENITTIWRRANFATGDFTHGLSNLAVVMLRIFRSFSRFFKPVAEGFRAWTNDLVITTGHTGKLNDKVGMLVRAARAWGGVMYQVARLVIGFFDVALPQGNKMTESVEDTVKAWADWMGSGEGQRKTRRFLADARDLTGDMFDFLSTIATTWFQIAEAARPFVNDLVNIVGWLARAAHWLIEISGGADGFVRVIAGLYIIRRGAGWAFELMDYLGRAAKFAGAIGRVMAGGGGTIRGALSLFGKRGTTPANPLFVEDVTGGGAGALGTGVNWKSLTRGTALRVLVAGGTVALAAATITALALQVNKDLPTGGGAARRRDARGGSPARTDPSAPLPGGPTGPAGRYGIRPSNWGRPDEGLVAAAAGAQQLRQRVRELSKDINNMARDAGGSLKGMTTRAQANFKAIRDTIGTNTREGRELASRNLTETVQVIARAMRTGRASTGQGMEAIRRLMRVYSQGGKDAVRANMDEMVDIIKRTMRRGGVVTEAGSKLIKRLMVDELKTYGLSERAAIASVNVQSGDVAGGFRRQDQNQRGGLYQYGRKGARGQDTIQTNIAGHPSMVAPGEVAAVFTGKQQSIVNDALMNLGISGLPGLFTRFNTPHAQGYQQGGWVGASPNGLNPAIRSIGQYAMRKYGAYATSTLRSGPAGASWHNVGAAVDLVSGNMLQMGLGLANSFGPRLEELIHTPMGFSIDHGQRTAPFAQADHYDHVHAAALGKAIAAIAKLKRVVATGTPSPLLTMVQRNLDLQRAGAQRRLDEITGSMGGGEIGMFQGPWTEVMSQIARQRGWNMSDWNWLVQHESGGRVSAQNPTSTAFGLGQLLDMNWGRYGGGPGSSGTEQIVAMANYILDRYRNPTQARRFWEGHNFYQGGGAQGTIQNPTHRGGTRRGSLHQTVGRAKTPSWWSERTLAPWRVMNPLNKRLYLSDGGRWRDWQRRITMAGARATTTRTPVDDAAIRQYRLEGLNLRRGAVQRRIHRLQGALGRMPGADQIQQRIRNVQKRLDAKGDNKVRGKARNELEDRLKTLKGRLGHRRELERELGNRRNSLTDLWSDIGGIREEIAGDAPDAFTPLDYAESALAQAELTPGREDDVVALRNIVAIRESLYAQALRGGDPRAITEAARNLSSARGALDESTAPTADQQAVIDQSGRRAATALESQRITEAAFKVFFGGGSLGLPGVGAPAGAMSAYGGPEGALAAYRANPAGFSAGQGGGSVVVQNNYMLHPSDPQVLATIGGAAAAGFGYQGYARSPRVYSGA